MGREQYEAAFERRDREQRVVAAAFYREHPEFADTEDPRDHRPDITLDDVHRIVGQPLTGRTQRYTEDEADLAERLDAVWDRMLPTHQDLLQERYLEQRTEQDMADDRGIRRQSLQDRLDTARADFTKLFGDHFAEGL